MEEGTKSKDHLISAAAFVEGGTQDACGDACSICLEAFSESDPPTVTGCKHDFHLQCILEWCQRSSQCPMCWQSISLKDPSSQELLDAIEQERNIANNQSTNSTIFHHPTFGDFELQQLPVSATEAELEERIIQHLAAAAAMGRARHIARREGHRNRTSGHSRPRYLGISPHPGSVPSPTRPTARDDAQSTLLSGGPPLVTVHEEPVTESAPSPSSVHAREPTGSPLDGIVVPARPHESPSSARSAAQSSPNNQDRAGPSEQNSLSDFKTRFNTLSMRYKDSFAKTTKNWKEKLFSRNNSPTDHGPKSTGEGSAGSAGIATIPRMMDRLQQDLSHSNQHSQRTTASDSAGRNEITSSSPPVPPSQPPPSPPGSSTE